VSLSLLLSLLRLVFGQPPPFQPPPFQPPAGPLATPGPAPSPLAGATPLRPSILVNPLATPGNGSAHARPSSPVSSHLPTNSSTVSTPAPTSSAESARPTTLNLDTGIDGATGVLGGLLILSGLPVCFFGSRNRWSVSSSPSRRKPLFLFLTIGRLQDFLLFHRLLRSCSRLPRPHNPLWGPKPDKPSLNQGPLARFSPCTEN
jgi:hypothetical protein